MADPQFHDFKDMLKGNQKSLDYDELKRRHDQKKADLRRTKAWIEDETNLDVYKEESHQELTLAEYYNSMPEVEMDPEVKEFWKSQSDEIAKLDMATPQTKYMDAYRGWQDLIESMDERRRDELGVNNINYDESNAQKQIKQANQRLKDAKKKVKDIQYDVDPFKAMIGAITGTNKDSRTIRDAYRGVREARKGVKEANRNLQQVRERRAHLEESRAKLSVKEYAYLEAMADAQEKIAHNKAIAEAICKNGRNGKSVETIKQALHQQYELIDKYKSIQLFKQDSQYANIHAYLAKNDKALADSLDGIPDNLSAKSFKVTLEGPLKLPSYAEKVNSIDKKIATLLGRPLDLNKLDDEKQKLSDEKTQLNLDKDAKQAELDGHNSDIKDHEKNISDLEEAKKRATIKDTDTKDTIQAEMDQITDKNSQEYKELKMKQDHLILQEEHNKAVEEVKTLKEFILNNKDSLEQDVLQQKLQELQNKQTLLKLSEEQLRTDEYSQNLAGIDGKISDEKTEITNIKAEITKVQEEMKKIEDQIKKVESIEKLIAQREELQQNDHSIQDLDALSEELKLSQTRTGMGSPVTIAVFYAPLLQKVLLAKDRAIASIEARNGRPINDPTQNQDGQGR